MSSFIKKTITHIKEFISRFLNKKSDKENIKPEYTDLAPLDNITNGNEYLNALDWALKNERIKNIALAGPYGAGKSSIIQTYLKQHKKIKAKSLRISMATFKNKTEKKDEKEKSSMDSNEIELGILKQLFYKVEHNKIPQSRFRKLHKISLLKTWGYLFTLCVIVYLLCLIVFPTITEILNTKINLAGKKIGLSTNESRLAFIAFTIICLGFIASIFRTFFARIKVSEVKLPINVEVKSTMDNTYTTFNKYMDEIIYFFEETNYQFVFFEDLDRLENPSIFVQLRELNTLLNNCDALKRNIVFIYAIKDDIFTNTNRTKFFDFIIPVIPIINSTNSGEYLLGKLAVSAEDGLKHAISQEFILDVSPYIEDMRILQNIYNEFIVFKKILREGQDLPLSDELMMALIIFKNLYPEDFADIQMEKGIIKEAFYKKNDYISNQGAALQAKIDEETKKIGEYNRDSLREVKELKLSLLAALTDWQGIAYNIISFTEGNTYTSNEILKEDFDLSVLTTFSNAKFHYTTWGSNGGHIEVNDFQKRFAPYYKRISTIQTVQERGLLQIQEEIETLKNQIKNISGWSLKKLLETYGPAAIFSDNIMANKLLVFLLRKGYINEQYPNYINYFKGNTVTKYDMAFILSVKNMEPLPYAYSLSKTSMIVQRLQPHEFGQRAIYNFDLMDYLLEEQMNSEKLHNFIAQLSDGSEESWIFINEFLEFTEQKAVFIRLLSDSWSGMWCHIDADAVLTYERKIFYLSLLVAEATTEALVAMDTIKKLRTFVEEHEDILQQLASIDNDKVIALLDALHITFTNIDTDAVPTEVLDDVFDNSRYELNAAMIEKVVTYKDPTLVPRLHYQNYTTIVSLGYIPLLEHVEANLLDYVKSIVLGEGNVKEDIQQIINLIHKNIDNEELCVRLIEHQVFSVDIITEFCGDLIQTHKNVVKIIWNKLLEDNVVCLAYINVNSYFEHYGFTAELIKYIDKHYKELAKFDYDGLSDMFIKEFILSNVMEATFEALIPKLKLNTFNIDLNKISQTRVSVMIQCNYFKFSLETYNELWVIYPKLCVDFIVCNQEQFMDLKDDIDMDASLLEKLLFHNKMKLENKQILLDCFGILHMNAAIAKGLNSLNLNINLEIFDTAWGLLMENDKRTLMLNNLNLLDAEKFASCFSSLKSYYPDFIDRNKRREVTIDYSRENLQLVQRLKDINYITSFEEKGQNKNNTKESVIICRIKAIT